MKPQNEKSCAGLHKIMRSRGFSLLTMGDFHNVLVPHEKESGIKSMGVIGSCLLILFTSTLLN